jgi:Flp pilus assembly protein TadD
MGRLSKAEKSFVKALAIEPNYPFYLILLGCTYVRMGQGGTARKIFGKAIGLDPAIVPYLESVDEYRTLSQGKPDA